MTVALRLALGRVDEAEGVELLAGGWAAKEALAIALIARSAPKTISQVFDGSESR